MTEDPLEAAILHCVSEIEAGEQRVEREERAPGVRGHLRHDEAVRPRPVADLVEAIPELPDRLAKGESRGPSRELLDHERTRRQIQRLDRFTRRGSKDTIDHRPGEHDDLANSCLGACLMADKLGYGKKGPPVKEPEPKTTQQYFNQRVRELVRPKKPTLIDSYRRTR